MPRSFLNPELTEEKEREKKEIKAGRKKTKKESDGGTEVGVILVMWKGGLALHSKHRLNNTDNKRSKLNH